MHREPHPLAGKSVRLNLKHPLHVPTTPETTYRIEDWWDSETVGGKSWMDCDGNPACLHYGMRSGLAGLPIDNEVVYGKVGAFGHLIHVSELGEPA